MEGHPSSGVPQPDLQELLREINELKAGLLVDSVTHDNPTFEGPPWVHEGSMQSTDRLRLDLPGDLDESLEDMVANDASLQYILSPQAVDQVVRSSLRFEQGDNLSPHRPIPSPYTSDMYRGSGLSPSGLSTSSGTPITPPEPDSSRRGGYEPPMTRDAAYMSASSARVTPMNTPETAFTTPASAAVPAATPVGAPSGPSTSHTTPVPHGRPGPVPTPQAAATVRRSIGSRIAKPGGIPTPGSASTPPAAALTSRTPSGTAGSSSPAAATRTGASHSQPHAHHPYLTSTPGGGQHGSPPYHQHHATPGSSGAGHSGGRMVPGPTPPQPPRTARQKLSTAVGAIGAVAAIATRAATASTTPSSSRIPSSRNASSTGPSPSNSIGVLRSSSGSVSAALAATPPAGSVRKRPSQSGSEAAAGQAAVRRAPGSTGSVAASHGAAVTSHFAATPAKVARTHAAPAPGSGNKIPGKSAHSGSSQSRIASPATASAALTSPHLTAAAAAARTAAPAHTPPPVVARAAATVAPTPVAAAAAVSPPEAQGMEVELSHPSLTLPSWGGADPLAAESLESLLQADPMLDLNLRAEPQTHMSMGSMSPPGMTPGASEGVDSGVLERRISDELLRPLAVALADDQGQGDWMEEDADAEMNMLMEGPAASNSAATTPLPAMAPASPGAWPGGEVQVPFRQSPGAVGTPLLAQVREELLNEEGDEALLPQLSTPVEAAGAKSSPNDPPPGSTVCKVRELLGLDDPGSLAAQGDVRELSSEELWHNITVEATSFFSAASAAGPSHDLATATISPPQADALQEEPPASAATSEGLVTQVAPGAASVMSAFASHGADAGASPPMSPAPPPGLPSDALPGVAGALGPQGSQPSLSATLSRAMSMQQGPPAHEVLLSGDEDESDPTELSSTQPAVLEDDESLLVDGELEAAAADAAAVVTGVVGAAAGVSPGPVQSPVMDGDELNGTLSGMMDTDMDGAGLEFLAAEAAAAAAVVVAGGQTLVGPGVPQGAVAGSYMEVDAGGREPDVDGPGSNRRLMHQSSSASSFGFDAAVAFEAALISRQLAGSLNARAPNESASGGGDAILEEEDLGGDEHDSGMLRPEFAGEALMLASQLEHAAAGAGCDADGDGQAGDAEERVGESPEAEQDKDEALASAIAVAAAAVASAAVGASSLAADPSPAESGNERDSPLSAEPVADRTPVDVQPAPSAPALRSPPSPAPPAGSHTTVVTTAAAAPANAPMADATAIVVPPGAVHETPAVQAVAIPAVAVPVEPHPEVVAPNQEVPASLAPEVLMAKPQSPGAVVGANGAVAVVAASKAAAKDVGSDGADVQATEDVMQVDGDAADQPVQSLLPPPLERSGSEALEGPAAREGDGARSEAAESDSGSAAPVMAAAVAAVGVGAVMAAKGGAEEAEMEDVLGTHLQSEGSSSGKEVPSDPAVTQEDAADVATEPTDVTEAEAMDAADVDPMAAHTIEKVASAAVAEEPEEAEQGALAAAVPDDMAAVAATSGTLGAVSAVAPAVPSEAAPEASAADIAAHIDEAMEAADVPRSVPSEPPLEVPPVHVEGAVISDDAMEAETPDVLVPAAVAVAAGLTAAEDVAASAGAAAAEMKVVSPAAEAQVVEVEDSTRAGVVAIGSGMAAVAVGTSTLHPEQNASDIVAGPAPADRARPAIGVETDMASGDAMDVAAPAAPDAPVEATADAGASSLPVNHAPDAELQTEGADEGMVVERSLDTTVPDVQDESSAREAAAVAAIAATEASVPERDFELDAWAVSGAAPVLTDLGQEELRAEVLPTGHAAASAHVSPRDSGYAFRSVSAAEVVAKAIAAAAEDERPLPPPQHLQTDASDNADATAPESRSPSETVFMNAAAVAAAAAGLEQPDAYVAALELPSVDGELTDETVAVAAAQVVDTSLAAASEDSLPAAIEDFKVVVTSAGEGAQTAAGAPALVEEGKAVAAALLVAVTLSAAEVQPLAQAVEDFEVVVPDPAVGPGLVAEGVASAPELQKQGHDDEEEERDGLEGYGTVSLHEGSEDVRGPSAEGGSTAAAVAAALGLEAAAVASTGNCASDADAEDESMYDAEEDGFEIGIAGEDEAAAHEASSPTFGPRPAEGLSAGGAAAVATSAMDLSTPMEQDASTTTAAAVLTSPEPCASMAVDGAQEVFAADGDDDDDVYEELDELPRKVSFGAGPALQAAAAAGAVAAAVRASQAHPATHPVKYARFDSPRHDEGPGVDAATMAAAAGIAGREGPGDVAEAEEGGNDTAVRKRADVMLRGGGPVAEGIESGATSADEGRDAAPTPGSGGRGTPSEPGSGAGDPAAMATAAAANAVALIEAGDAGVTVSERLPSDASASSAFASVLAMAAVTREVGSQLSQPEESGGSGLSQIHPESCLSDTFSLVFSEAGSRMVSSTAATSWATPNMSRQPTFMGRPPGHAPQDAGSFSDASSTTTGRTAVATMAAVAIAAGVQAAVAEPAQSSLAPKPAAAEGANIAPKAAEAPSAEATQDPAVSQEASGADVPVAAAAAAAVGTLLAAEPSALSAVQQSTATPPPKSYAVPEPDALQAEPMQQPRSPPVFVAPPVVFPTPAASSSSPAPKPPVASPHVEQQSQEPLLLHAWQVLASPSSSAGSHDVSRQDAVPPSNALLGSRSSMRSLLGGNSRLSRVSSRRDEEEEAAAVAACSVAEDEGEKAEADTVGAGAAPVVSGAIAAAAVARAEIAAGVAGSESLGDEAAERDRAGAAPMEVDGATVAVVEAASPGKSSPFLAPGAGAAAAVAAEAAGTLTAVGAVGSSGSAKAPASPEEALVPAWKLVPQTSVASTSPGGSAAATPSSATASLGCRRSLRNIQLSPSGSRLKRSISQASMDGAVPAVEGPTSRPRVSGPHSPNHPGDVPGSETAAAAAAVAAAVDGPMPSSAIYDSDDEEGSLQPAWKVLGTPSKDQLDSPDAVAAARGVPLGSQPSFRSGRSGHSRLRRATATEGEDTSFTSVGAAITAAQDPAGMDVDAAAAAADGEAAELGPLGAASGGGLPPRRSRSRTLPGTAPSASSSGVPAIASLQLDTFQQGACGYSSDGSLQAARPPPLLRGGSGGRMLPMGLTPLAGLTRSSTLDSGVSRLGLGTVSESGGASAMCASRVSSRRIIPDSIGSVPLPRRSSAGGGDPNVDALRPAWQVLPMNLASPVGSNTPGSNAGGPSGTNMLGSMRSSSRLSRMSSGIPEELLAELKLQAQVAVGHLQGSPHGDDSGGGLADMMSSAEDSTSHDHPLVAGTAAGATATSGGEAAADLVASDGAGGTVHAWKLLPLRTPTASSLGAHSTEGAAPAGLPYAHAGAPAAPRVAALGGRPVLASARPMNQSSRLAVASTKVPMLQVSFEPSSPSVHSIEPSVPEGNEDGQSTSSEGPEDAATAPVIGHAPAPPADDTSLIPAWKLAAPVAIVRSTGQDAAAIDSGSPQPSPQPPPLLHALGSRRSLKSLGSHGGSRLSRASLAIEDFVDDSYSTPAGPLGTDADHLMTADTANQVAVAAAVAAAAAAVNQHCDPEPQADPYSERSSAPARPTSDASEQSSAISSSSRPALARGNTTGSVKLQAEDTAGEGVGLGALGAGAGGSRSSQRSSRTSSSASRTSSMREGSSGAPWELGGIQEVEAEGRDSEEPAASSSSGGGRGLGLQVEVPPSGEDRTDLPQAWKVLAPSGNGRISDAAASTLADAAADAAGSKLSTPGSARRSYRSNSSRLSRVTSQVSESGLADIVEEGAEAAAAEVDELAGASAESNIDYNGNGSELIAERVSVGRAPPPAPSAGKARIGSPVPRLLPGTGSSGSPVAGSPAATAAAAATDAEEEAEALVPAWKILAPVAATPGKDRPDAASEHVDRVSPGGFPGTTRHTALRYQRSGSQGNSRLSRMTSGLDAEQDGSAKSPAVDAESAAPSDVAGQLSSQTAPGGQHEAATPQEDAERGRSAAQASTPAEKAPDGIVHDAAAPAVVARDAAEVAGARTSESGAAAGGGSALGSPPPVPVPAVVLDSSVTTQELSNLTLANLPSARLDPGSSAVSAAGGAVPVGSGHFSSFTPPPAPTASGPAPPSLLTPGGVIKEEEGAQSCVGTPKARPQSPSPSPGQSPGEAVEGAVAAPAPAETTTAPDAASTAPPAPAVTPKPQRPPKRRGLFACFACFGGSDVRE